MTLHRYFFGRKDLQILHITGQTDYNDIIHTLNSEGLSANESGSGRIVVPYLHEMPKALAAANLVISRAGAIGLAELTLRGIPAILIPYPHASENHQEINARALESNGAAIMIRDAALTGEGLCAKVQELLDSPDTLRSMAAASTAMGHPNAAKDIADIALELACRKSS